MYVKIIQEMIEYFREDVRRINHALKVFSFSRIISESEKLNKFYREVIDYSSILHDIGIKEAERKYNSSSGRYQEIEGPPVADKILSKFNIKNKIKERVSFIIGNHHTYDKIDDIDFQVIVESDFIVNIYEDSIKRDVIKKIRKKFFKTSSGLRILNSMYRI